MVERVQSSPTHGRWLPWASLLCVLGACGDELPLRATVVEPVLGDPCQFLSCGEHGACITDQAGGPTCVCDVGYAGATCVSCERGFHTDATGRCAPDRACADQMDNPCGQSGSCRDEDGVISCHCDPGYEGPRCTLCQNGFARDENGDCLELVLSESPSTILTDGSICEAESCNGNGLCDDSSGRVVCACSDGYDGVRCASCKTGYRRDESDACVPRDRCSAYSCSTHGLCDDSSGKIQCACEAGYGLPFCASCAPGFHTAGEAGCERDTDCLATTCGGHGTCAKNGSALVCACATGYQGERCESCANGYHRDAGYACVNNEVCTATKCGGHGTCTDATGVAICACDVGYTGSTCGSCAAGFHKNQASACVLDETCKADSCAATATCDDKTGEVACVCMTGYAGADCEACAPEYARNAMTGACEPYACTTNPIKTQGLVQFDNLTTFPTFENNCISGVDVNTAQVSFASLGGQGDVWACSANTLYSVSTNHVFLEATNDRPARITFKGQISEVTFDYGARSPLSLEIMGDGQVVRSLEAARRASGSLALTFATPISVLSFKPKTATTQQIAIDNLKYTPPACR